MTENISNSKIEKTEKIEITAGGLENLEEIVALNEEIFSDLYSWPLYNLAQCQEKLADKQPIFFLAKIKGETVGSLIAFTQDQSLYLWALGVKEKFRNHGVASKLIDLTEQAAKTMKLPAVTAKVYNVSAAMLRLLKERGYQIVKVEPSAIDLKYDAVHLELKF